jgi:hypothetical protein
LEDEKIYKLVTIDYLILGGDGMDVLTNAEHYTYTSLSLREIMTEYFTEKYRQGLQVDAVIDGRVIIME